MHGSGAHLVSALPTPSIDAGTKEGTNGESRPDGAGMDFTFFPDYIAHGCCLSDH